MYADIKILSQTLKDVLAIPREALIRAGEGDRVIIALGQGRYTSQSVKLGIESGSYYQILSGITTNDVVVTSAQFLIDSESNLKAALSRMQSQDHPDTGGTTPHEFVAMGKIKKLDHAKRLITLYHQPIPELDMPAMTMEMKVSDDVNLMKFKPGDAVHFVIVKQDDDTYLVENMQLKNKTKLPAR